MKKIFSYHHRSFAENTMYWSRRCRLFPVSTPYRLDSRATDITIRVSVINRRLSLLARSPFASPEIMNKGITSSSCPIYAITPLLTFISVTGKRD